MLFNTKKSDINCMFIDNVQSNEDNYSWRELNCFYKPFAISLKAYNEQFYSDFLLFLSYYAAFGVDKEACLSFNKNHVMFDYFNHELSKLFKAKIKLVEFNSEKSFHNSICENISEGNVVIVPTDLYQLPYSQNYLEKHHRHYMIIKGYDRRKNIYYVLDNMHKNFGAGTKFEDFMIQYPIMYNMCSDFKKCYDSNSYSGYYWTIESDEVPVDNYDDKVLEYFKRVNEGFVQKKHKKHYIENIVIDEMSRGIFDREMYTYLEEVNIRNIYYNTVIEFLGRFDNSEHSKEDEIVSVKEELIRCWDDLKTVLVYKYNKCSLKTQKLSEQLDEVISLDEQFTRLVYDYLSYSTARQNKKVNYLINNKNKAKIDVEGNNVKIILSNDKIYDTWKNRDEGCQIIWRYQNNMCFIETSVLMDSAIGNCCLAGIVIKTKNKKYLYGSRCNTNIDLLEIYEGLEVTTTKRISKAPVHYRVEFNSLSDLTFMWRDTPEDEWNEDYHISGDDEIMSVGIITKSWEFCNCRAEFVIEGMS